MRKYYERLNDCNDYSPSRLIKLMKQVLPTVIFIVSLILMLVVCGALEVM